MAVMVDIAAAVRSDKPSCQMLAGRAGVMILLSIVDEVLPGEQAALGVARCQCLWHTGQYAGVLACQYLIAVEIAAVGHGGDLLAARGLLCLERHGRKLVAVVPLIGHLVGYDQMVLGVDGDLYIVADGGGTFAAGRHRTGVGVGQRDLLVGCVLNRLLHHLQGAHLPTQAGNLLLQPDRLGLGDIALFAVGSVHRFELAAVDCNNGMREQLEPTAKLDKLPWTTTSGKITLSALSMPSLMNWIWR